MLGVALIDLKRSESPGPRLCWGHTPTHLWGAASTTPPPHQVNQWQMIDQCCGDQYNLIYTIFVNMYTEHCVSLRQTAGGEVDML